MASDIQLERFDTHPGLVFVVDPNMEQHRSHEEAVHVELGRLTTKHLEMPDSPFRSLDYDVTLYPEQRLDIVGVRSDEPASTELLMGFAAMVYPGLSEMIDQMTSRKYRDTLRRVVEDYLMPGKNFIVNFDHGRIPNTAVDAVAFEKALEITAADMGDELPKHHRRITLSKILSRMKAIGMPSVELVALAGEINMSYPPTLTMLNSDIDDGIRHDGNDGVRKARETFEEEHENESIIDYMSGSGTQDVEARRQFGKHKQSPHVHMAPMSFGTADMFTKLPVLPIAGNINNPHPRTNIGEVMPPAANRNEAQIVMFRLAELGHEATKIPHTYHPSREDYLEAISKVYIPKKA